MKKIAIYSFVLLTFIQCGANDVENNGDVAPIEKEITPGWGDLYGLIEDDAGNPIKGVVVSDGYTCVQTDVEGIYRMKRDTLAQYVFYSTPPEYDVNIGKSGFREFHKKINVARSMKMRADFKLKKKQKDSRFFVVGLADPQVANSEEVGRFQHETLQDIKNHFADASLPFHVLVLGDIVADKKELLTPMRALLASVCPSFFAIAGNHDKFTSENNHTRNSEYFSSVFGPPDYSFNIGDVHFVCMDNIIFAPEGGYSSGFSDEQIEWLKQDLSYVDKNKMIIMSYHRHTLNKNGDKMHELLKGYREVHIMAGHTHANSNIISSTSPLLYQHVHGAACGRWWASTINADGTPNGYAVYEIENNTIKNGYYKAVNYDKSFQLRLYRGNAEFGGQNGKFGFGLSASQIVANVWNTDEDWIVDVYENGIKTGSMSPLSGIDAWATGYHNGVLTEKAFANTNHLYSYTLKNPNAEVKVVATDRFGNEYVQTQFTTDLSAAISYTESASASIVRPENVFLKLQENPVRDFLSFELMCDVPQVVRILLTDMTGRRLLNDEEYVSQSVLQKQIDLSRFPEKNMYLLSIESEYQRLHKRIIRVS